MSECRPSSSPERFWALRSAFRSYRGAFRKLVAGFAVLFIGAVGVESLGNLNPLSYSSATLEVLAEEVCEMLGATLILWAVSNCLKERSLS